MLTIYTLNMWAFTIKNKITAALLLFFVLCLVLLTNLQEQRMVKNINKAVTSLYEDRLVVGSYILSLSNHIDDILNLLSADESTVVHKAIDIQLNQINRIIELYDKTVLTEKEQSNFNTFKALCVEIKANNSTGNNAKALEVTRKADYILDTLSFIQVEEGKSKLDEVLGMTNTSNILSYIEIVVLIIIAVLIQIMVFSSKTLLSKPTPHSNHHLN